MIDLGELYRSVQRSLVMGIVNATGDSFSEGPESDAKTAPERAFALLEAGADLLDIGGESTRPGAETVPPEIEIARIAPVISAIKKHSPDTLLSIDTRKAEVAKAALDLGADIINDVSIFHYSPEMPQVIAPYGAVVILNHSRGTPQNMRSPEYCDYGDDVVETVVEELREAKNTALAAGIAESKIWVDPGLGFAKSSDQDWELVRRIDELHELGPIVAGFSRKSFLGRFLNQPEALKRLGGTIAVALYLADREVEILRVHDVRQIRDALKVRDKLR